MASRKLCGLLTVLAAVVLLWAPPCTAKTPKDIYGVSNQFEKLDAVKTDIGKLHGQINSDLENSQTSPTLFVLHDLEYFSQMARLELHNLVEVFVLTDLPAEQTAFREEKDRELRTKLKNVHIDMERRRAYVRLIQPPDVPEHISRKIEGYVTDLGAELQEALDLIDSIREQMGEAH